MTKLAPSEVFVPGRFPVEKNNVFANRGNPQSYLQTAFTRGFVPVVYGSYGVGKSSLVMFSALTHVPKGKIVYVESVYKKSLADIFQRILECLGYEVVVSRSSTQARSGKGEVGLDATASTWGFIKATFKGKLSRGWNDVAQENRELAVTSPSDAKLIDICDEAGLVVIIDELHRSSVELTQDLSAFVKAYANRNCRNLRLCLVGTESDASRLVNRDPGVDRTLEEISLESITDDEAKEIITVGFERCDLQVPDAIVSKVVSAGVGSPFVVQFICLEMAERALRDGKDTIQLPHYEEAIQNYTRRKAQRLIREYKTAVETVGDKRYRKQILHAMANIDEAYVTMDMLVSQVSLQLKESIPSTALSGPLRALKSDRFGKVLRDVQKPADSGRVFNYSTFSDPAMKSTIRMIERIQIDKI